MYGRHVKSRDHIACLRPSLFSDSMISPRPFTVFYCLNERVDLSGDVYAYFTTLQNSPWHVTRVSQRLPPPGLLHQDPLLSHCTFLAYSVAFVTRSVCPFFPLLFFPHGKPALPPDSPETKERKRNKRISP